MAIAASLLVAATSPLLGGAACVRADLGVDREAGADAPGTDGSGDSGQGDAREGGDGASDREGGGDHPGSGGSGAGGAGSGGSGFGGSGSGGDTGFGGSGGDTGFGGSGNIDAGGSVAPTVAGQLVITEIMIDTTVATSDLGQWIEIYNPGAIDVLDLFGCQLFNSVSADGIGRHVTVAPAGFVTLARSIDPTLGFIPTYNYSTVLLGSTGDSVGLRCGGTTIDRVDFTTWPVPKGRSLSLDPRQYDAASNDAPSNWCPGTMVYNSLAFDGTVAMDYGSPGVTNPPCQ